MSGGLRSAIRPVRVKMAKSAPRQNWEMLNWGSRLITTPNDYRAHGLYLRGKTRRDALRFLSVPRAKDLMWPLNEEHELLENKLLFESHFRALGLPVPRTLAVLGAVKSPVDVPMLTSPEQIRDFLVETVRSGTQLAVKPINRWGGAGIIVVTEIDGEDFVLSNGDRRAVAQVTRETSVGTWLVQQRIVQHPELAKYNESSLNTLRLGTFRRNDGKVEIIFAKLRFGRKHAQLDSNTLGGFSVSIDPKTGAFADRGYQLPRFSITPIMRHPDSLMPFAGRVYPYWGNVVSLAEAFAQNAGKNRFIGWDVASTEEGPLFVEGNHSWDVQLSQSGSGGMLTDNFIAMYNEDAVEPLDLMRPPPFRPLRALSDLQKTARRG